MTKLTVDKEFRQLLPTLDKQTYEHDGIDSTDKLPIEMAFNTLTNAFSDELHRNLKNNDPLALKAALMFYITELGGLYRKIA